MKSKQATRDRLLFAARALFADGGYEGTSIRQIASRAKCNLSLIQYYFGSKEGLLREVLGSNVSVVRRELESALDQTLPVEDGLRTFVRFLVGFVDRNDDLIRVAFRELLLTDSPIIEELQTFARGNIAILGTFVEAAKKAGVVRPDVDARFAGPVLVGMVLFYFIAYPITRAVVGPKSPELLGELADTIVNIYLHGILAEDGDEQGSAS